MQQSDPTTAIDWEALLQNLTFVAFDTETTGLSANSGHLVEIAAVKFTLTGGVQEQFQSLIDPGCPIPWDASRVHGLFDADVRGQPSAAIVLPRFAEFVGSADAILVAHNAPFDLGFLRAAWGRHQLPALANPVLCTLSLSRRHLRGLRSHQLSLVAAHLAVPRQAQVHRALADSILVQGIATRLLASLPLEQRALEVQRVHPGWSSLPRPGADKAPAPTARTSANPYANPRRRFWWRSVASGGRPPGRAPR